jgi:hypothetical protein
MPSLNTLHSAGSPFLRVIRMDAGDDSLFSGFLGLREPVVEGAEARRPRRETGPGNCNTVSDSHTGAWIAYQDPEDLMRFHKVRTIVLTASLLSLAGSS